MPEIRQNMATKEWVIIATERAKRPKDFITKKDFKEDVPEIDEKCPFCPGNEEKAPPETFRIEEQGKWLTRVVPNKFAAVTPEGERLRKYDGIYRYMTGVGVHEVIIESPVHNRFIPVMNLNEVENIVRAYRNRYVEISKDKRIEHIIIFKNHGPSAGTSLIHPHSQVIALPLVPQHIRHRIWEANRFFDDNGVCVFCHMAEQERKEKERIVYENEHFLTFCPYASFGPFHMWIVPNRHMVQFSEINENEISALADTIKTVISKLNKGLNNPDYNLVVRSGPVDVNKSDSFHWYIAIVPRLSKSAGFELGSGMFINVSLPEQNAEFLRNVEI